MNFFIIVCEKGYVSISKELIKVGIDINIRYVNKILLIVVCISK